MKLSISNIAWSNEHDKEVYHYLKKQGFVGLEIAPTRIFPNDPYSKLQEAEKFYLNLRNYYKLNISSIQSIWYGKNEMIFGSEEERKQLTEYTKKAIDFASVIKCNNLVFGCPRNRMIKDENYKEIAYSFFSDLASYAKLNKTILSMEPNPSIYNTNFINYTDEAFKFAKLINSDGFKVNLDLGTIIYNNEDLQIISDNIELVNHIHISEPRLALIEKRELHNKLVSILKQKKYNKYISIEMGKRDNLDEVKKTIDYIREVFK